VGTFLIHPDGQAIWASRSALIIPVADRSDGLGVNALLLLTVGEFVCIEYYHNITLVLNIIVVISNEGRFYEPSVVRDWKSGFGGFVNENGPTHDSSGVIVVNLAHTVGFL
jgi:hypothetical protein